MNRQKGTGVSKKYIVSLILVLCLLVLFFPTPVKAQNTVLIEECESMHEIWVDGQANSQPYIAAYMTTDFIENETTSGNARAIRVTVSLSGTDKSVIQSDNWLEAGIAIQGPDSVHGGCNAIDWGYTIGLMLAPWMHPDPFVHVEVFEGHEWVNCLPGYVKSIYCWNAIVPGLTVDSYVTLTMEWTEDTLDYYTKVGETTHFLLSYTPNETAIHCFKTGTVGRKWWEIPLPNTVKYFQFYGAWSNYNIGEVGWLSHLSYPGFIETGESSWTGVSFAYSTDGPNSYWDNTLGWGGDPYEGVDASYYYKHVHFYPTSDGTTLEPDTLLWAGGGGGGCPHVYTWDGQRYVMDNNLLPAAEHSNGVDVEDYYRLEQLLAPTYQGTLRSIYSLQIREFEHEHDYFDQVKLLAADHDSDVKVAVTPNGEILTYSNPIPPISAVDDNSIDVLSLLSSIDENYYQGYNGSYVTLTFAPTDVSNGVKLVIREDRPDYVLKSPVYIKVLNATGDWDTVAVFHTRTYWATDIINMAGYLPDAEGNLKVRLCFVSNDKIDYIGLDTTPQTNIGIHQANLIWAFHSKQGNVRWRLIENDNIYVELIPGEQIQLTFLLPNNQDEERTFILYTEGHYNTIQ